MVNKDNTTESYLLSLAGEYAVASELCRRNIYAQLTFGNRKKVDLLIDTGNKLLRAEVKTKQRDQWRNVKGVAENGLLIFVDFEAKELERPDFFILTFKDWKSFVIDRLRDDHMVKLDTRTYHASWDNWDGINIGTEELEKFRDRWDKIKLI